MSRRQGGVDGQRERAVEQQRDGREILDPVGHVPAHHGVERKPRRAADQHDRSILRPARHGLAGDDGIAARPVLHDHGLVQRLRHVLRDQAGDDIGQPAGGEGHHQPCGARRLRLHDGGQRQGGGEQRAARHPVHRAYPPFVAASIIAT